MLAKAEANIKEKDNTILILKEKINEQYELECNNSRIKILEAENEELRDHIKNIEDEHEKVIQELINQSKSEEMKTYKKVQKELGNVYKDILNLSSAISGILKGDEPNIQAFWGITHDENKEENVKELSLDDIEKLKTAVDTMRTNICDYYADKYSNECNIQ